jgi:protocatechuate 3,4-dioxygenase beta subunit
MRLAAVALAALLASATPVVQQGSIAGVILSGEPGRPVARAVVTLSGATLRPTLVAITDAQGRFAFPGLAAGQYTATASKTTYISMAYGQTTAGRGSGLPITLNEGQQLTGLTWSIPRGAVITGRIVDDRGLPMRDVSIVMMHYRLVDGERTLQSFPCCVWPQSGSDGTYRVYGLLPGEYVVSALPPSGGYVYLPEPFVPGGSEARQASVAEVQWALKELAAPTGSPEPAAGPDVVYTRHYFPGTTDQARATPVVLTAGEERGGIDFAMKMLPSARIEGRVVGPDGQPVERPQVSMAGSSTSAPGSTFVRRNLTPGRYTISARGANNALWGRVTVDVNGQDVLGLEIKLEPSATVSGRIVFESSQNAAAPNVTSVRVSLRPAPSGLPQVAAQPAGTFNIAGPDPGRYRLHASIAAAPGAPPGQGWILKSVTLNGRDVSDEPFPIAAGQQIDGVVVTFTDRPTELTGTLFDSTGKPAPGFYVVAFSTDRARWIQGSRRLPAPVRAATDGSFRFAGLPAGTYHLAAVTAIDPADLADVRLLEDLARAAVTVTIADGQQARQDLRFK